MARSSTTFKPGNQAAAKKGSMLAVRHGARTDALVHPEAEVIFAEKLAEIMELPYTQHVDEGLVWSYSYIEAQLRRYERWMAENGLNLWSEQGKPLPGSEFYLRLMHRQQEMAKVLGLGAAPRAAMLQAQAGARLGSIEIAAAQQRLRARQLQESN